MGGKQSKKSKKAQEEPANQEQSDQEQLKQEEFVLKDYDKPLDDEIKYQMHRVSHSLGIVGDIYLRPEILGQIPKLQKWGIRDLRFCSVPTKMGQTNMYLDKELSQFVGTQFRVLKNLNLIQISMIEPLVKLDAPNLTSIAISGNGFNVKPLLKLKSKKICWLCLEFRICNIEELSNVDWRPIKFLAVNRKKQRIKTGSGFDLVSCNNNCQFLAKIQLRNNARIQVSKMQLRSVGVGFGNKRKVIVDEQ